MTYAIQPDDALVVVDVQHDFLPGGALGVAEGEPVALDGGITNRNYRVRFGGREYVVRLPGKDTALLGISRDAERIANAAAATLGIAPTVAAAMEATLLGIPAMALSQDYRGGKDIPWQTAEAFASEVIRRLLRLPARRRRPTCPRPRL